MVCNKCGHIFEGKFCPECGTPVEEIESVCPKCGKKFVGKFCPECGTPIVALGNSIEASQNRASKEENKSSKKKHGCLLAIIAIVILFVFVGVFGSSESSTGDETKVPTPTETVFDQEDATNTENDGMPSTSSNNLTMDDVAPTIETIIAQNFENYNMEYDDTGITLSTWSDNIASAAGLAVLGNQESIEAWDTMRDSVTNLCTSIKETLDAAGLENKTVMVNVLNDQNTDNVLLSIINGVVFYDAVEDEE